MFLVVCATEFELQPLLDTLAPEKESWTPLLSGVGMVETTLKLSRYLEQHPDRFHGVLNFGVAGAYVRDEKEGAELLDICLAEQEVFGDFGICHPNSIEALGEHLVHRSVYPLDSGLLVKARRILQENDQSARCGKFITVCGVTASVSRGTMLGDQYDALCENMEGAAVARVCEDFALPLLEIRSISNFVEARDLKRWQLHEACAKVGKATALLLNGLPRE